MTFSQSVKAEIQNHIVNCDREKIKAFFSAFVVEADADEITFFDAQLADFFVKFLESIELPTQIIRQTQRATIVAINRDIRQMFKIPSDKKGKSYFLAGLFCARGSISAPQFSDYHLEMTVSSEELAYKILEMLASFYLGALITKRRNRHVIYIKQVLAISDLLSVMHAEGKMLEFENYRIEKDHSASRTRVANCENANNEKAKMNGQKEVNILKKLDLDQLTGEMKAIALLRIENPEKSYAQLADKYNHSSGNNITRQRVAYLIRRLCERKI